MHHIYATFTGAFIVCQNCAIHTTSMGQSQSFRYPTPWLVLISLRTTHSTNLEFHLLQKVGKVWTTSYSQTFLLSNTALTMGVSQNSTSMNQRVIELLPMCLWLCLWLWLWLWLSSRLGPKNITKPRKNPSTSLIYLISMSFGHQNSKREHSCDILHLLHKPAS